MHYIFKINSITLKKSEDNLQNIIEMVDWDYIGINEKGIMVSHNISSPLPPPDSENFIPYEDITRDNVITWLEEYGVGDITLLQQNIQKQIKEKENPTRIVQNNPFG